MLALQRRQLITYLIGEVHFGSPGRSPLAAQEKPGA